MSDKPYLPTTSKKVLEAIRKAIVHNNEMDGVDRSSGFGAPSDSGLAGLLRTAISAFVCGMELDDWKVVAEGVAMVMEAELLARKTENRS